jgi:hypothetical protein
MCRFSAAGDDHLTTRFGGRRLKSAKARNRGGEWYDGRTAGYGDLAKAAVCAMSIRLRFEHNLIVTARILLNGEFTFCAIHDFNGLAVVKEHARQLSRNEPHDKPGAAT